jgi:Protein of unknown function (DUF1360)
MTEMRSSWLDFLLALLATWRLSHLVTAEDGPGDALFHLRKYLADSFFGRLMDCFGCVSLWVAALFAFFVARGFALFVVWLALSGGAMLIERLKPETVIIEKASEGDDSNELLR